MKYECDLIKDILPLYADEVCSEASRRAVEGHLAECAQCRRDYEQITMPDQIDIVPEISTDEKSQIEALKKVKKKWTKSRIFFTVTGGIIASVIIGIVLLADFIIGAFGAGFFGGMIKGPEVYEDIERYTEYINTREDTEYMISGEDAVLFPKEITDNMEVVDFKFIHFNPWDPQTLAYLTVRYTDDDYRRELERLSEIGIDEYKGIYSVTDKPAGFNLAAMETDEYHGFIYALTPENEDNTVTYAGMMFCNFLLDLDINKYMPEKYLLEGFNAGSGNPYRKTALKKFSEEQDAMLEQAKS